MNWKEKLTNIYNLASLHSWIKQVDEMIINFLSEITKNEEIIEYIIEGLKSEKFTNEHNIISLVLLKYLDYPILQIINLANEKLYGKISKNDIDFLKKHLFSGNFPLSSDLSYDITNRSFLSPKKAIKKAMQIDTVISKENPQLTVLYMCFIISRMDMNEENRAMVAFLLLRIDIDLPQGLQQRVFNYLWEYKDIIQELLEEESDGPVLLENIKNLQEKISKVKIVKAKKEAILNIPTLNKEVSKIKPKNKKDKNEKSTNIDIKSEIEVRKKSIVNDQVDNSVSSISEKTVKVPVKVNTINKAVSNDIGTNIDSTEKISNTSKLPDSEKKLKSVVNSEKKPTPVSVIQESPLTHKYEDNDSYSGLNEQSVPNKMNSNYTDLVSNVEKSTPNENIEKENKSKSNKMETLEKKNWSINLKKNKDILESILNGIFQKSSSTKNPQNKSNNSSSKSLKTNNKNSNQKNFKIIKHKKLFIGVGGLIILSLSIFFAVGVKTNRNTIRKNIIDKPVSVASDISNSDNSISQSKVPIMNETKTSENGVLKQSDNIVSKIPSDFPFNISMEGNNLSWKVVKGDSITGLFYALKEYKTKLKGTALEKLSNMDWETFFDDFKINNPKRTSYHIIFPHEIFILSLN